MISKSLSACFKVSFSLKGGFILCVVTSSLLAETPLVDGFTTLDLVIVYLAKSIPAYAAKAPKTNRMQAIIHADKAVIVSVLGEVRVILLKMLIKTRNKVTKSVILPGTISGGIRKLDQETMTKSPDGK